MKRDRPIQRPRSEVGEDREDALDRGMTTFAGKLCPKGHYERYVTSGGCAACDRAKDRKRDWKAEQERRKAPGYVKPDRRPGKTAIDMILERQAQDTTPLPAHLRRPLIAKLGDPLDLSEGP